MTALRKIYREREITKLVTSFRMVRPENIASLYFKLFSETGHHVLANELRFFCPDLIFSGQDFLLTLDEIKDLGLIPPVFLNLDRQIKENSGAQDILKLLPGFKTNLF